MNIRGFTKFGIKVFWKLQLLEYLRTLSLKFQKAQTKIEVVLALPCWLSQLNWDSQQGRVRTTSILVSALWNFKLKVLKYPRTCSLQYTLIPNFWHPLTYILTMIIKKLGFAFKDNNCNIIGKDYECFDERIWWHEESSPCCFTIFSKGKIKQ